MSWLKRTDLRETPMGDDLMVFDERTDKVHVLNITSAFVWRCLDEAPDLEALAARLRERFQPDPAFDTRGLAQRAIAQLEQLGLFQPPAAG